MSLLQVQTPGTTLQLRALKLCFCGLSGPAIPQPVAEAADRERVRRNAAQGVTSSLEALVEIVGGDSGSADERSPSVPLRVARVSGFLNEVMLTSENGTAPPEDAVEKLQGLLQDIQSLKETMKEDEQHAAAAGAAAGARHGVGRGAAAATAFIAAA